MGGRRRRERSERKGMGRQKEKRGDRRRGEKEGRRNGRGAHRCGEARAEYRQTEELRQESERARKEKKGMG